MTIDNHLPFPPQAYVTSHVSTAIYVLDFLKRTKARGAEQDVVEREIQALMRLQKQASQGKWSLDHQATSPPGH